MKKSIGQQLSAKRIELNQTLEHVAEQLNIRMSYLEAIENDNYSVLPGKAYVSGFIKSYAEYLELDVEEILKMLKATQDLQEDYQNMPKQLYKDYNRTKNIFLLSLVILIISTVAFSYYLFVDHQINIRKIEQKSSSSETLVSFFNESQHISAEDQALLEEKTSAGDLKEDSQNSKDEIELYSQKSKPPFARVLLKANDDVWVQIRPINKKRIYVSKTIPKGKYYWVTPWDNVVLDVSDASRLELIIDEVNKGAVGPNSKRVRGLFLDVPSLETYYKDGQNRNSDPIENYYKEPDLKPEAKVEEAKQETVDIAVQQTTEVGE